MYWNKVRIQSALDIMVESENSRLLTFLTLRLFFYSLPLQKFYDSLTLFTNEIALDGY